MLSDILTTIKKCLSMLINIYMYLQIYLILKYMFLDKTLQYLVSLNKSTLAILFAHSLYEMIRRVTKRHANQFCLNPDI